MKQQSMTEQEIKTQLAALPDWALTGNAIQRELVFSDFVAAFGFMSKVAPLAERANHHPDWSNSYNRLTISLSTHDAGGLTEKDFSLAHQIDQLALAGNF